MANNIVIKINQDSYYPEDGDIERLIKYIAGKGDNENTEEAICGACGLSKNYDIAIEQLIYLQYFLGKIVGRRMYHWMISFDDNLLDVDKVASCAKNVAEYFFIQKGHACFWGVHTSTDNLHMHIAVNAINRLDTKKWHSTKGELELIKQDITEICDSIIEKI